MVPRHTKLDSIFGQGLEEGTVDALFATLANTPEIRQPVQEAIDNLPITRTPDGKMICGPDHVVQVRGALMKALEQLASTY